MFKKILKRGLKIAKLVRAGVTLSLIEKPIERGNVRPIMVIDIINEAALELEII